MDVTVKALFGLAALGAVATVALAVLPERSAPAHRPSPVAAEPRAVHVADPHSAPVRLRIPALRVSAAVMPLSLDETRTLDAPSFRHAMKVGWYALGPRPGERGPAVLVGHRDAPANPGTVPVRNGRDNIRNAVFAKLGRLRAGDRVEAELGDGRRVRFRVTAVDTYPTAKFPTARVYGPVPGPELRLITCGGVIDADGHWDSNVVVSAVAETGRRPG
ncbi:sortase [Streptomyces sp. SID3212]|uniref:sortase domain-containing protein n=1 Tax=Streptomyces sp. SID3212 TaxID=2690259 RepID=UPI00136D9D3F|nr:sortase [Streptomyces sp. SID3212]